MGIAEVAGLWASILLSGVGLAVAGYAAYKTGLFNRRPLVYPSFTPVTVESSLLPEGFEGTTPNVREAIDAWLDRKWQHCEINSGHCQSCDFHTNEEGIKSHCGVDRYIRDIATNASSTEQELLTSINQQMAHLIIKLDDVTARLDKAENIFGDVAWLRRMVIAGLVLNSGSIVTGLTFFLRIIGVI